MWFLIEDKKGDFLPGMDKDVGNTWQGDGEVRPLLF